MRRALIIGNTKYQSLERNELDEKDSKDNTINIVTLKVKQRNPKGITNYAIINKIEESKAKVSEQELPENIFEEIANELEK